MPIHLCRLLVDDRDRRDLVRLEIESTIPLREVEQTGSPDIERRLDSGREVLKARRRLRMQPGRTR